MEQRSTGCDPARSIVAIEAIRRKAGLEPVGGAKRVIRSFRRGGGEKRMDQ